MNTSQLSDPKQQLEPEELEYWELHDFDDVVQSINVSSLENEFVWNNSYH